MKSLGDTQQKDWGAEAVASDFESGLNSTAINMAWNAYPTQ